MNTLITGTIDSLSSSGAGILRHEGRVVFVPFVVPGETVEVEITHQAKNFAHGRLQRILTKSPHRVEPPCGYFGKCGGCQLQHVDYPTQLQAKQKMVHDALTRIGKLALPGPIEILPSPQIWEYRRHITLQRRLVNKQWQTGFIGADSQSLVEIERCLIYEDTPLPVIKGNADKVKLVKVTSPLHVLGCTFAFSQDAFLQVNAGISEQIYSDVLEMQRSVNLSNDGSQRKVLDLYCGIGITSILLAKEGAHVVGAEISPAAIALAQQNAEQLTSHKPEFHCVSVEKNIDKLLQLRTFDSVLLNPPRQGAGPQVMQAIVEHRPQQIIYISCDPATLARDLQQLAPYYTIQHVKAYDMFPHTMHVETVVVAQRIETL